MPRTDDKAFYRLGNAFAYNVISRMMVKKKIIHLFISWPILIFLIGIAHTGKRQYSIVSKPFKKRK